MKVWQDSHVFNYPWETVAQAAYRKYPTRHNPNVKCIDVLDRSNEKRCVFSHRLFATVWTLPDIIWRFQQVVSASYTYVHEQSICNADRKTLIISSVNVSLSNLFKMTEILKYSVHPNDPSKTLLQQTTTMDVHGIPLLGDILETMFMSSYEGVIAKGRLAIQDKSELIIDKEMK